MSKEEQETIEQAALRSTANERNMTNRENIFYLRGVKFGAHYQQSKTESIIKEVLKRASEAALMKHHCGTFKHDNPTRYHQMGADNIQIDKQSILDVNYKDLI